jgi:tetratricopeptide (TPR) repeat protein
VTSGRRGWGAGALIALAALLLVVAGAVALMSSGGDPEPKPKARQEPKATATQEPTRTPEATQTATASPEPTATASPPPAAEQPEEDNGKAKGKEKKPKGDDAAALQLQAYNLNNARQPEQALPLAQRAVELCRGSTEVTCAYALYEYARALRMTGDPEAAIAALEERKQRFPDNQPAAVEQELARARKAAGE